MNSIDIFPWDNNFNTGIQVVDEQHKKLVKLLNVLASHIAFKSDLPELNSIFDELANYAVYHFKTEEAIWHQHFSDDVMEQDHKKTHQSFIDEVTRLRSSQAENTLEKTAEDVLSFLARWLASHILESDRHMSYFVAALQSGMDFESAKNTANEKMTGATKVLIEIILSIYELLSSNTLHLMRELAERKRNEKALIQAKIEAETANIAKTQFLATMSHEIRTPMNSILGMAQMLQAPQVTDHERQEYAKIIYNSADSLFNILNDVINVSKVEAGKVQLNIKPFKPVDLIQEIHASFQNAAKEKGLKLDSTWTGNSDDSYLGDVSRLNQMLSSFVRNAVKFSEKGEIKIEVKELGRKEKTTMLEFSVTDTGIGISDEKLSLLFQPFSQVDSSLTRKFGGTGLGLSIVQGLAKLMDGQVGVESKPGFGSRFWFQVSVGLK